MCVWDDVLKEIEEAKEVGEDAILEVTASKIRAMRWDGQTGTDTEESRGWERAITVITDIKDRRLDLVGEQLQDSQIDVDEAVKQVENFLWLLKIFAGDDGIEVPIGYVPPLPR